MKRILTLAVLFLCLAATGNAQNVYGGDFEHWKLNPGNYYDPDSSFFSSLDTLVTVPTPSGITAYPCDTAHTGAHSAGLQTSFLNMGFVVLIPGVIGTIKVDMLRQKAILGIPYPFGTTKPTRFTGWYRSYPLSGDSSAAVLLLSKWNSTTHKRDTLAYNRYPIHWTVDTWTQFDLAVNYLDNVTMPDSLTMLFLSCGGFNASNMFGSVGQVGSRALFDDVNLTDVNGFPLVAMPSVKVKLSPNPASQNMKVELERSIDYGYFEVYDAQAKLIRQYPVNGNRLQVSVNDLSAGNYYYKLTEKGIEPEFYERN
jgi:hypothetical protein